MVNNEQQQNDALFKTLNALEDFYCLGDYESFTMIEACKTCQTNANINKERKINSENDIAVTFLNDFRQKQIIQNKQIMNKIYLFIRIYSYDKKHYINLLIERKTDISVIYIFNLMDKAPSLKSPIKFNLKIYEFPLSENYLCKEINKTDKENYFDNIYQLIKNTETTIALNEFFDFRNKSRNNNNLNPINNNNPQNSLNNNLNLNSTNAIIFNQSNNIRGNNNIIINNNVNTNSNYPNINGQKNFYQNTNYNANSNNKNPSNNNQNQNNNLNENNNYSFNNFQINNSGQFVNFNANNNYQFNNNPNNNNISNGNYPNDNIQNNNNTNQNNNNSINNVQNNSNQNFINNNNNNNSFHINNSVNDFNNNNIINMNNSQDNNKNQNIINNYKSNNNNLKLINNGNNMNMIMNNNLLFFNNNNGMNANNMNNEKNINQDKNLIKEDNKKKIINDYYSLFGGDENVKFPLIGLNNVGMTCYMNSTLQCLLHIPELNDYFLNKYPAEQNNLDSINNYVETHGRLSKAYFELAQGVFKQEYGSYSPKNFNNLLARLNPQFSKYESMMQKICYYIYSNPCMLN